MALKTSTTRTARSLFRIQPFPHESVRGLMLRACDELELPSFSTILYLAGIKTFALDTDDSISGLAHFLRLQSDEVKHCSYWKTAVPGERRQRAFFGRRINVNYLTLQRPRVCPMCLSEKLACYAQWDVSLVTVCTVHQCELIDTCPGCSRLLSWYRPRIHLCGCGFDLRNARAKRARNSILALTTLIVRTAGCDQRCLRSPKNTEYAQEMHDLPLNDLLNVIVRLGWFLNQFAEAEERHPHHRMTWDLAACGGVIDSAHAVLADWPRTFIACLDAVKQRNLVNGAFNRKLATAFGPLYRHLYVDLAGPQFAFLREVFEDFVFAEWDGVFKGGNRRFRHDFEKKGRWISASQAEAIVEGASRKTFVRLVHEKAIQGFCTAQDRNRRSETWMKRESFEAWRENSANFIPRHVAEEMLGLNGASVMALGHAGILPYEQNGRSGPHPAWLFEKNPVERLRDAIRKLTPPTIKCDPDKGHILLRSAVISLIGREKGFPAIIQALMDGKLTPVGRIKGAKNIFDYVFKRFDLIRFRPLPTNSTRKKLLNAGEIAKALFIGKRQVAALVRQNFLVAIESQHGVDRLVPAAKVNEFKRCYIFTSELSRKFDTTAIRITSYMESIGIHGIALDIPNLGKTVFYKRSEVARIMIPKSKSPRKTR